MIYTVKVSNPSLTTNIGVNSTIRRTVLVVTFCDYDM